MLEFVNRFANNWAATPVIHALARRGVLDVLAEQPISISQLVLRFRANAGHLQVALRILFELGWIDSPLINHYQASPLLKTGKDLPEDLDKLINVIMTPTPLQKVPAELYTWLSRCTAHWQNTDPDIAILLEGALLTPILSELHGLGAASLELPPILGGISTQVWNELQQLFVQNEWGQYTHSGFHLSPSGRSLLESGGALGMLMSYAAMFRRMEDLLFGDAGSVFDTNQQGHEGHIDRTLNVTVSGWQHQSHFAELDLLIIDIFTRTPLAEQPRYIADMGCGDGSLLLRIYQVISTRTPRGQALKSYPLILIGIDYNVLALEATGRTLAELPHYLIKGDIADPQQLVRDLIAQGINDLEYILHIRTFLDHDRPFVPVEENQIALQRKALSYSGVYVTTDGQEIDAGYAVQSLVEHLRRWKSVVSHFGLILLEVHCLRPATVRRLQNSTESLYFDAYHAFSRQQLVEAPVFLMSAVEAGLFPKQGVSRCIPKTADFTRISLHCLMPKPYTVRHPTRLDLPELEKLDRLSQPENLHTPQHELLRRLTDFPLGQMVLELDRQIVAVLYTQRIESVDALYTCQYRDLGQLHRADGRYLQLLGLYVLPEMHGRGYSDALLELMLTYCAALEGIDSVVGVTRCANFVQHKATRDIACYIQLRNDQGQHQDSMLHFHASHGATIHKPLYGFRPKDTDNDGIGVLIEYFLHQQDTHLALEVPSEKPIYPLMSADELANIVRSHILKLLGHQRAETYGEFVPLMEMGLSSLELLELRRKLGESMGELLSPTFLFSYGTAAAITAFFAQKNNALPATRPFPLSEPHMPSLSPILSGEKRVERSECSESNSIAIIGMACRFPPNADTPEKFWQNLIAGTDSIGLLPDGRQSSRLASSHRLHWRAGFLREVDLFDARFFRISPLEAELLDPQQRLLLEIAWETLESAAIAPSTLRGTPTGVFIGLMGSGYQGLITQQNNDVDNNAYFATGNACSVAAGRLSYFFDWRGPALSIDTACSSSLVAIHTACCSLLQGECDFALAAGVNLLLDDRLFMAYQHAGMLSPDGHCKTFDTLADGYVRGEGCAAIALKKLQDAQNDGDRILAVIRGSAINQDGSSSGLTAPNQPAQQAVIQAALSRAGVNADEISYLEAHGTGTKLGDPIEVMAAAEALGNGRAPNAPLLIGSVKSSIGHLEAAAGIAGLIKVVLSMEHDTLPSQLHFSIHNPLIPWENLPVKVVSQTQKWPAGVKRAGLSSFGFSGTNGHLIIEEYRMANAIRPAAIEPVLIILSARTKSQLHEQANKLLLYISDTPLDLHDLAYTLQVGREAFGTRLAFTANALESVKKQLAQYIEGSKVTNELYQGDIKQNSERRATGGEDRQNTIDNGLREENIGKLAALWVNGGDVEWQSLYSHVKPQRINLPTYVFNRESYWIPVTNIPSLPKNGTEPSDGEIRHPLLHRNTSNLGQVRYSTTLTGNESFLRDHRVRGEQVVPGVAQLEWARAAMAFASDEKVGHGIALEQVTWLQPLRVTNQLEVHICLHQQSDGRVHFKIYRDQGEEGQVYSQGYALYANSEPRPQLDIPHTQTQCFHSLTGAECYSQFALHGFQYGASFQVLKQLTWGNEIALGVFCPGAEVSSCYEWPFGLLDGALQATLGLIQQGAATQLSLPFALEQVMQWAPLSNVVQVVVQPDINDTSTIRKLVLFLVDADGQVALRLSGFSMRPAFRSIDPASHHQPIMISPQWDIQSSIPALTTVTYQVHGVILCEIGDMEPESVAAWSMAIPAAQPHYLSEVGTLTQRYTAYAQYILCWLQQAVKDARSQPLLLQIIVPDSEEGMIFQGLSGLLNSAQQEYPALKTQLIVVEQGISTSILAQRLRDESVSPAVRVHYGAGLRKVFNFKELEPILINDTALPWRDDGVYLITGGLGGLGQIFVQEITNKCRARVILTGRSPMSAEYENILMELRSNGANIIYKRADVSDLCAISLLLMNIIAEYGQLNGVIHSAGIIRDSWLAAKTPQELQEVLAPKVAGLIAIDRATQDIKLDWLVLCSSISSVLGSIGQTDYATANGFMDAYAEYRTALVAKGLRHGRTVSIGWPLWAHGGMQMDIDAVDALRRQTGQIPMPDAVGLRILRQVLAHQAAHIIVGYGEPARVRQRLLGGSEPFIPIQPILSTKSNMALPDVEQLCSSVERFIITLISTDLKIKEDELGRDIPFPEFGYDSIMLTSLSNKLNSQYNLKLSTMIFFEYPTIATLVNYLVGEKREEITAKK